MAVFWSEERDKEERAGAEMVGGVIVLLGLAALAIVLFII